MYAFLQTSTYRRGPDPSVVYANTQPCRTFSEVAISQLERLRQLHQEFLLDPDPAKKHEILDELLTLVQEHWNHFLGLLASEEDPVRLNALVQELDQILETRKARAAKTGQIPPLDPPPPPKKSGTEPDK
jgi:hypothetical protein